MDSYFITPRTRESSSPTLVSKYFIQYSFSSAICPYYGLGTYGCWFCLSDRLFMIFSYSYMSLSLSALTSYPSFQLVYDFQNGDIGVVGFLTQLHPYLMVVFWKICRSWSSHGYVWCVACSPHNNCS